MLDAHATLDAHGMLHAHGIIASPSNLAPGAPAARVIISPPPFFPSVY